jgi:hypothetical protein
MLARKERESKAKRIKTESFFISEPPFGLG